MKTAEYLDQVKEKLNLSSDYQLAREIGVSTGGIANYRKGRNTFDQFVCFQVADILEINPAEIIANIQAERETDKFKREYWLEKAQQFGRAALLAGVILGLMIKASGDNLDYVKFKVYPLTHQNTLQKKLKLTRVQAHQLHSRIK